MFGTVVLGLRDELFENVLASARTARGVASDADLSVDDLRSVVARFRDIAAQFPIDPTEQLRMAIEAVFASWNGKRAVDYRNLPAFPMTSVRRSTSRRWCSATLASTPRPASP